MKIYDRTQKKIIDTGHEIKSIIEIVNSITLCKNISEAKKLLKEFETAANELPWPQDHDFGALLLQKEYEMAVSKNIGELMIETAYERAFWCATCSTSGGEGLARSVHVKELNSLRKKCI